MGRARYNQVHDRPRVIVDLGRVDHVLRRDEAEDLCDSIRGAVNDLDTDVHDAHRRFLDSIPKDPATGMLEPATPEQWRRLLDEAGLENVKEPG